MATGHYARRIEGPAGAELHAAADPRRDQSYFLFATTRAQLDRLRFPLGGLASKDETRALAVAHGLEVAAKPDSQDICFAPAGHVAAIARLRPDAAASGDIVDEAGRVLGRHDGVIRYTVGQRRGLGIGGGEPLYVLRIDAAARRVVVGPRAALAVRRIALRDVNWLGDGAFRDAPAGGWDLAVKVRSTRPPVAAQVVPTGPDTAEVALAADEQGVAPGQASVFYAPEGSRVFGGGWIVGSA
jgi:tRNA-specific 2-thiouridylase